MNEIMHKHIYDKTKVKPTCTTKGYTLFRCKCGSEYKTEFVDYLPHKFLVIETKNETCMTPGFIKKKCEVCGSILIEDLPIKKESHVFDEWVTVQPQTCTTKMLKQRKCKICGFLQTETGKKPAHSFSDWIETPRHNCSDVLIKKRVCNICGYVEIKKLPGINHDFTALKTNSIDKDSSYRYCKKCGYEQVVTKKEIQEFNIQFSQNGNAYSTGYCGTEKNIIVPEIIYRLGRVYETKDWEGDYVTRYEPFHCKNIESIKTNNCNIIHIDAGIKNLYAGERLEWIEAKDIKNLFSDNMNQCVKFASYSFIDNIYYKGSLLQTLVIDESSVPESRYSAMNFLNKKINSIIINENVLHIQGEFHYVKEIHFLTKTCNIEYEIYLYENPPKLYFANKETMLHIFKNTHINSMNDEKESIIIYVENDNPSSCKDELISYLKSDNYYDLNIELFVNNVFVTKIEKRISGSYGAFEILINCHDSNSFNSNK